MAILNNPNGQVVSIPVTSGMDLEFSFDPGSESQLSREGDNLIFSFEDGGRIVLTDFYAQELEQLPAMDIQGAQISAEDFLASLGDETLLPAAGPTAQAQTAAPDGGAHGYGAEAADLVGGIDAMGMLGRTLWGSESERPLADQGLAYRAAATGADAPGTPGAGVVPGTPDPSASGNVPAGGGSSGGGSDNQPGGGGSDNQPGGGGSDNQPGGGGSDNQPGGGSDNQPGGGGSDDQPGGGGDSKNHVPTISKSDNLVVHEDGLANGSNPGHQISADGSLSIESEDGLATIKIAGMILNITAVDPDTGVVSYEVEGSETVPHGDFSVSGITAVNGVYTVYYSYTLTGNSLDHIQQNAKADAELLPEPLRISVEAIDVAGGSTGEGYFTLDILDDNPLANSDWVWIDPENSGAVYGNLNAGYWGTSKGEYANSAAEKGQGDGAADNWGADGGRVSKVWLHSDDGVQNEGYDIPVDGYVDVPTESGTLRVYSNGDYEFTPELSRDVTLYNASGGVHPASNSDHDLFTAGYRVEAMSYDVETGVFTNQDLHITNNSSGEMGKLIGVKHGDTIGKSNDSTEGAYGHKNELSSAGGNPEGLLITVPDSLASCSMSFGLVNFRDGVEQANWIVYYADGHTETGHSNTSDFSIDLHEGATQVFLYANNDGASSFYVGKIATTETMEAPFHDVCFDYEVTDGDGDTSVAQLHIHDDDGNSSSHALSSLVSQGGPQFGVLSGGSYHSETDAPGQGDPVNDGNGILPPAGNIVLVHEDGGILNGEAGNDIFTWKLEKGGEPSTDSPTKDIIKDFSMDGLGGKGDDQLDLRDLLSSAREDNLDNYLTISKNGDSAELHIHLDGNPGGGASKIIVLENVYSSHSDSGLNNTEAVDELIKQHIILNS